MFEKYLFITDADGTLLTDDKRILPEDLEAIRQFTARDGLFTLATGRGVTLTRPLAEMLKLELPAIVFNGAAIYDFTENKFLWQCVLPSTAHDYIHTFKKRFSSIGVEILINDVIYVTSTNPREEEHISYGSGNPVRCDISEVPDADWIKILIVDEPDTTDEIIRFAESIGLHDVYTVRSSPYYFEILPKGVNKGGGLKKLLELKGIKNRTIIAAGDFMNDIEMLKEADISFAVANAEAQVKECARYICKDNNSGSASDIIGRIDGLTS